MVVTTLRPIMYRDTIPAVVIRSIEFSRESPFANQSAPSGPVVIALGEVISGLV